MFHARRLCPAAFLFLLVTSRPAVAQWASNGNGVCVLAGEQSYPATASDGAGGAFVVWEDHSAGSDLYLQRITATGAIASGWTANGNPLCTAANDQRNPVIAADGAGGVFVAWEDERAGLTDSDIYLQRITSTGALATGWPAGGLAICSAALGQQRPTLEVESGAAIVAWEDTRGAISTDVYAQKASGAGAVLWTADGVPVCTFSGSQTVPSVVGDKSGGAIVAWQDARGAASDIYVQRLNTSGAAQWTANGVALCGATNDQLEPRALADGAGGAIVAWDDYRANNGDVYAQRVSGAGAAQWTGDGVALCSDPGEQYGGAPISDGAGGAIVPWDDFRNGPGNLYAQRITAAGTVSWTANGLGVCTIGDVSDPVAAPDGTGGAFFVWDDARVGGQGVDLYTVRLTAAGALGSGWTSGGTLICNAANNQLRPVVTTDASGSVITSWFDDRSGNYDIYSKRLAVGGGAVDVPVASPSEVSLAAWPNPMRAVAAFRFALPSAERGRLEVLDVTGRVVRVLLDDELPAGPRQVLWDGRETSGELTPAGLYLVRLVTSSRAEVHRVSRLR